MLKTMKTLLPFSLLAVGLALLAATGPIPAQAAPDSRCFELRVYYAAPGKLDALNARFRDHTMAIFQKHGMTSLGYWLPVDNTDNKLIYLLAFPSREAARTSWREFGADPEWKEVAKQSEANGRLVTKVESTFLTATDFSPPIKPSTAPEPRAFELRTYQTPPGKLDALLARFRDHTCQLFAKHGMTQFGYFVPMDADKGADHTLIYLLIHKDQDEARRSFQAFLADPDWIAAKAASEKDGPLTLPAPDGVKSVFMKATDYSPSK